jgi:hypothetical protein
MDFAHKGPSVDSKSLVRIGKSTLRVNVKYLFNQSGKRDLNPLLTSLPLEENHD